MARRDHAVVAMNCWFLFSLFVFLKIRSNIQSSNNHLFVSNDWLNINFEIPLEEEYR